MEIARIFFSIALFSLGVCWLCNIMMLFTKPHNWCELLIFPQLVWFALGIIVFGYGEIYFDLQTKTQWYLVTYGYPVLLLPIQFLTCNKFVSLYQKQKQDNEKFLYLTISQVISMIMFSLVWILLGYAVIWSQAS